MIPNLPFSSGIKEIGLALDAALKAGDIVMDIYKKEFKKFTKEDDSPITEADLKSNQIIKERLTKTGIHLLSEEEQDDLSRLNQKRVWVVDPLDGTTDFVNRTGEFTVMIALVDNQRPVLGIINYPSKETIYLAEKNQGAFRYSKGNWKKIFVSKTDNMKNAHAVGSRHHLSKQEKSLIKNLGIGKFSSLGSSLKVCSISEGESDVYITTTNKMKEWDTCASYCIISEAGGKMTDMLGNDLLYNNKKVVHPYGILATNGLLHQKVLIDYQKML